MLAFRKIFQQGCCICLQGWCSSAHMRMGSLRKGVSELHCNSAAATGSRDLCASPGSGSQQTFGWDFGEVRFSNYTVSLVAIVGLPQGFGTGVGMWAQCRVFSRVSVLCCESLLVRDGQGPPSALAPREGEVGRWLRGAYKGSWLSIFYF